MTTSVTLIPVSATRALCCAAAVCLSALSSWAQGVPLYRNFGLLSYPPALPLDAVRIENLGNITASGTLLWDSQNTLHFINSGTMSGVPGFRFDHLPFDSAIRRPLQGFTNSGSIYGTTDILIRSTNVNNFNGLLSAGRNGRVSITSTNAGGVVSLFNSRIRAGDGFETGNFPEGTQIFINNTLSRYQNPSNVVDQYWGVNDNAGNINLLGFQTNSFFGGAFPTVINGGWANFTVTNRLGVRLTTSRPSLPLADTNFPGIPGYSFFVQTNLVPINNAANQGWRMVVQAVLVQTNLLENPLVRVYFHSQVNRNNFFPGVVSVEFGVPDFDEVTGQVMDRYLILRDRTATNIAGGAFVGSTSTLRNDNYFDTFRPGVYELLRSDLPEFPSFAGFGGFDTPATPYDPGYFWYNFRVSTNQGARFQTNLVPHAYSAWQFLVSPRNVPPGSHLPDDFLTGNAFTDLVNDATNSPGRIEINAHNLDLGNATLRADNSIHITASNILDMAGARFNAQHVNINVTSTNSTLILSNTFPNSVARINGQIAVWSGFWQVDQLVTNAVSSGFTSVPQLDGTNTIDTIYHLMVVSLDQNVLRTAVGSAGTTFFSTLGTYNLSTNKPVDLPRLRAMSAHVELHDTNTITRELSLGGDCLVIGPTGSVALTDGLQTFGVLNAPRLLCLTNSGLFTVPQQANFGFDRFDTSGAPFPYQAIVNNGTMSAGTLLFRSDYFENVSNLVAFNGSLFVDAFVGRLSGTNTASLGGFFSGGQLVATNSLINVGGNLQLSYTDLLSDAGFTNDWYAGGGISVDMHPLKGDLLATRINLSAPTNLNRTIVWAAQDRGDNPSGFNNNVALRELVLDGAPGSIFRFRGPNPAVTNALYVNTLTFTNHSTNYTTGVAIDANLKVYFASSTVPPDKLTNAFPGRFIWVSTNTAAGPMVSLKTTLAGRMQMNSVALQALLASNPDVDGDGIPNDIDETPLSGFTVNDVRVINLPPLTAVITWQGVAGWAYTLEYRDSLDIPVWTKLKTTIPSQTGTVTELDTLPSGGKRFYRVRYTRP